MPQGGVRNGMGPIGSRLYNLPQGSSLGFELMRVYCSNYFYYLSMVRPADQSLPLRRQFVPCRSLKEGACCTTGGHMEKHSVSQQAEGEGEPLLVVSEGKNNEEG